MKMLREYDLANRELTRSLAQLNDQIAHLHSERERFETIIFELQNENQLFKRQKAEQDELLGRYEDKRLNLSRALGNLRKYG
jgi:septal ring factor EnvC (AmiA/AmiB activator)